MIGKDDMTAWGAPGKCPFRFREFASEPSMQGCQADCALLARGGGRPACSIALIAERLGGMAGGAVRCQDCANAVDGEEVGGRRYCAAFHGWHAVEGGFCHMGERKGAGRDGAGS